jgi:replication factor A2
MSGFGGGYDANAGYGGGAGYGVAGNGGGFGGGGYMESGGASQFGATQGGGGGGGDGGRQRSDTLQPVTIKQLLDASHDAPDDKYTVNGEELGMVTFIGRILSCDVQVTMITLRLDDCSGGANVVYMIDPEQTEYALTKRQHIKEHAWVRIIGNVREVDGALQVDALYIRGVESLNELTYHRLEVVRVFLSQTRPRPATTSGGSGTTPIKQSMSKAGMSNAGMSGAGGGGIPYNGNGNGMGMSGAPIGGAEVMDGMTPKQSAVYIYLKQLYDGGQQEGVHIHDVTRDVPSVGTDAEVRQIMDVLASEGHVYSTIDEDHFAFCMA